MEPNKSKSPAPRTKSEEKSPQLRRQKISLRVRKFAPSATSVDASKDNDGGKD